MTLYIHKYISRFPPLFMHIRRIYNNHLPIRKSNGDVSLPANHVTGNKQFYSPRVLRREQITMEERAIIGAV